MTQIPSRGISGIFIYLLYYFNRILKGGLVSVYSFTYFIIVYYFNRILKGPGW